MQLLPGFAPAVVLADVRMPRMDGITLLRRAREGGSDAVFVMMTAFASVEAAVEAMRAGAENYLVKPLDVNAVLVILDKALEKLRLQRDTANLRERVRERYRFHNIVGDAPELQAVYEVVKRAAPTRATVLILGESGTGKELIAQALHEESPRADEPFIKVNCAALSETLLESELFGHEKGSFTGAIGPQGGAVRAGRRRHALPGRDRRHLARAPDQAPARPAAEGVRAGGRHPDHQGGRPAGGRHQPRPGRRGEGGASSARTSTTGSTWWR